MTDISWPCDPRPKAPGVSSQSTCCRKPADDGNTVRGCLILSVSIIPTIVIVIKNNVQRRCNIIPSKLSGAFFLQSESDYLIISNL